MNKVLIVILFFIPHLGKTQNNESDKIYCTALTQYVISIDSLKLKYPKIYSDVKEIYLEKPQFVDSLPSLINNHPIVLITPNNQHKLYIDHNKKLIHTIMFPLTNEKNEMYITITPYHGELKKHNHYSLVVSDGTTVYFKFDCDKQKYVVDKVENWGI
jgi:hypothetical protein